VFGELQARARMGRFFFRSKSRELFMPILLAIEAAADGCSVALTLGDESILTRFEQAPRMHSRVLYPMLDSLLAEAGITPLDLDAVVFGKGPGSFTGLRIAAATAQGIGFGADVPLIGVSTLQSMAQQARALDSSAQQVLTILDARMNELYFGGYEWDEQRQLMTALCDDFIAPVALDQFPVTLNAQQCVGAGNGWALHDQLSEGIKQAVIAQQPDLLPQAQFLLPDALSQFAAGQLLKPEDVELVYLREQSHWKTIKEQKQ